MRDGMPAPGWWIASDGRWYPPELHPDVRAAVVVAPTAPAVAVIDDLSTPSTFDLHRESANGTATTEQAPTNRTSATTTRGADAGIVNNAAALDTPTGIVTNGAALAAAPGIVTNAAAFDAARGIVVHAPATVLAPTGTRTAEKPTLPPQKRLRKRTSHPRGAVGVALAIGTLAVIVSVARGHDDRPSLDRSLVTTTVASPALTTDGQAGSSVATNPNASSATTPPTTAASAATTVPTSAGRGAPAVVSVFDLVKGNCLDGANLSDGLVTTIRVVDCADVHTHEVYYSGRYPEATFDAAKIAAYANDTCLAQFAQYVGIDYTRSRYQYLHIVPTQESWARDNDRDVVCVAFEEDATITGSIANRAQ